MKLLRNKRTNTSVTKSSKLSLKIPRESTQNGLQDIYHINFSIPPDMPLARCAWTFPKPTFQRNPIKRIKLLAIARKWFAYITLNDVKKWKTVDEGKDKILHGKLIAIHLNPSSYTKKIIPELWAMYPFHIFSYPFHFLFIRAEKWAAPAAQ